MDNSIKLTVFMASLMGIMLGFFIGDIFVSDTKVRIPNSKYIKNKIIEENGKKYVLELVPFICLDNIYHT